MNSSGPTRAAAAAGVSALDNSWLIGVAESTAARAGLVAEWCSLLGCRSRDGGTTTASEFERGRDRRSA